MKFFYKLLLIICTSYTCRSMKIIAAIKKEKDFLFRQQLIMEDERAVTLDDINNLIDFYEYEEEDNSAYDRIIKQYDTETSLFSIEL